MAADGIVAGWNKTTGVWRVAVSEGQLPQERATRIGFKMTADLMEPLQEAYENKLAELRGKPAEA